MPLEHASKLPELLAELLEVRGGKDRELVEVRVGKEMDAPGAVVVGEVGRYALAARAECH